MCFECQPLYPKQCILKCTLISIAPRCSVTNDPLMSSRIFVSKLMWIFSAVKGIHTNLIVLINALLDGDGHHNAKYNNDFTFSGDGHHAGNVDSVTKEPILGHLTAHNLEVGTSTFINRERTIQYSVLLPTTWPSIVINRKLEHHQSRKNARPFWIR